MSRVKYNCVGWAAIGDSKVWWEPPDGQGCFWPQGIADDGSMESYIHVFQRGGYVKYSDDTPPFEQRKIELLYEKVALYGDDYGGFLHVAYQLFNGWTSKLGSWEDIKHLTLECIAGDYYGKRIVIMRRRCSLRGFCLRTAFNLTAKLWAIDRARFHHVP